MELDPRLQSSNANGNGGHGPSSSNHHHPHSASPSGSPSAQLLIPQSQSQSRHHGADASDPSLGANPLHHQQQHHDSEDGADAKRPRACEACRGLKVRCEPDVDEEGPCKRCKKAGRNCVVTAPTRKRQKKTDSRVAELEKKIDALTASIQARGPSAGNASTASPVANRAANAPGTALTMAWRELGAPPWTHSPGGGHAQNSAPVDQGQRERMPSTTTDATTPAAGTKRKFSGVRDGEDQQPQVPQPRPSVEAQSAETPSAFGRTGPGDIVDRGLITIERATELFARYNNHMVLHLPAVVFPPGTTIPELRKNKPTLFLAVMAAATSESPALQKILQKELMTIFAEKVIITGEKNLEIVQSLLVAVIWYWPPEHFEELKFYQLVHIAAVMAIDIGLGQKQPQRRGKFFTEGWRTNGNCATFRRSTPPDPTTIECRRTWLTCHFLAANTSMALHRPNLVRWSPFMTECVSILESSPDAAPTDKYFCHLVWTHRLAEEVGIQFSLEDPSSTVNVTDMRTQYALRGLERDLEKYRAAIPQDLLQPTLKIGFNVVSIFMHVMVIHSSSASNTLHSTLGPESLRDGLLNPEGLTAAHISAISASLTAIDSTLTTFLSMDVFSIRCLPVFNFVRVAYALVILIKLYFSAALPGSELGKVINKDDLKVQKYLDALLDKFRETAAEDRSRPAAKFLVVLVMLRTWFSKQIKADNKEQPPTPSNPSIAQQHQQIPNDHSQAMANTPLQLLSEVAAGSSTAAAGNTTATSSGTSTVDTPGTLFGTWSGVRQQPQPFFHDSASNSTNYTTPPSSMPPPPDNMASADLMAAMGPGIPPMGPNGQGAFFPTDLNYGLNAGFDLEGLGLGMDTQDMYENGVRMLMHEPWFNDMFPGMPGPGNVFNF